MPKFSEPFPDQYDFNTDEEYNEAINKWQQGNNDHQRKLFESESKVKKQQEEMQTEFTKRLTSYGERRGEMTKKVADFEAAEQETLNTLTQDRAQEILFFSDVPENIYYAMSKNAELLEKYQNEPNPVKRGMMISNIEKGAKFVSNKKPNAKPTPRKPSAGSRGGQPKTSDAMSKAFPDAVFK